MSLMIKTNDTRNPLTKSVLSLYRKMSDLNKDNALNLQEFCIAMHLVVAVRHGIDLPDRLPPIMLPSEYQDSTQGKREHAMQRTSLLIADR